MAVQYSELLSQVLARVSGKGNAFTTDQYRSFINEGKDELWKALVATTDDYFLQSTVTTPSNAVNLFAPLSLTVREYVLPGDCLKPRFIEVLGPAGYEMTQFIYRKIHHPDFQDQRNLSTQNGPQGASDAFLTADAYYYTIVGKNTLMLARYPEVAFTLKVWYVRALPDMDVGSSIDETVVPFKSDIVNFAVKRCELVADADGFAGWLESWKASIVETVQAAGPRSEGAIFVQDAEY